MISSTVFPVISDGNFGVADIAAVALKLVPLLEATTRVDDVWAVVVLEVEVIEAAELEPGKLNTGAVVVDCACEDEVGADGFVDNEKPVKELVLPDVAAAFVTPNPVKELTAADEAAELAGAADEEAVVAEDELKLNVGNAGVEAAAEEEAEAAAVLAAGV